MHGWKARQASRSRGVWAAVVAFATGAPLGGCLETPVDAIVRVTADGGFHEGGGTAGTPMMEEAAGGTVDLPPEPPTEEPEECPGPVSVPWVGTFSIRSLFAGLCMHSGETTVVTATAPHRAFTLKLTDECQYDEWELAADPYNAGYYIVQSLELVEQEDITRNLDIEMGETEDGTRALLYAPVTAPYTHQRFTFLPREPFAFEIRPLNVPEKCLTVTQSGLGIWSCDPNTTTQLWELVSGACE